MGEVVKLRRPRRQTIRGVARASLTEAMSTIKDPVATVIAVLGADGTYAMRSANTAAMADFDMYSRAGALLDASRMKCLADKD
jgi:hypothetical protein